MKERLLRVAKWAMYPAFYVACLALFGYLTFPFGLLKDRVIAEFARKGKPGQRLEIEKLSSYWFSGVEVTNVKLVLPPDEPAPGFGYPSGGSSDFGGSPAAAAPPKEMVIVLDEAHVRVRILPLLIGRVRVDFWASTMGGEIRGMAPVGGSGGDVELELTKIDLNKIEPLTQALGIPVKGSATGKLALSSVDGKFSKADGALNLTIEDIVVGDGKAKIAGILELPAARVGTLTLTAEAKEGVLKVTKLAAQGADRGEFLESIAEHASTSGFLHVLAAFCGVGGRAGLEVNDHSAPRISAGDGLLEHDLGVAGALRGEHAEDVRRHHAERRAPDDLLGERARAVAEHDLLVVLLDDVKVALDPPLEIDHHRGHLLARQARHAERVAVRGADLVAHLLPDHADEAGGLREPDDLFQRPGEVAQERSHEPVQLQRDGEVSDRA